MIGENLNPLGAYLAIDEIIELAKRKEVDAIHPGYGFLSENPEFARACEKAGILFIGPPSQILGSMGDKLCAKALAQSCGIPTIPGCTAPLSSAREAADLADSFGYPVILKAAAAAAAGACAAVTPGKRSSPTSPW